MFILVSVEEKVTFRCIVPLVPVVVELHSYENRFTFVWLWNSEYSAVLRSIRH